MNSTARDRITTAAAVFGTFVGGCEVLGQDASGYIIKAYAIRVAGDTYTIVKQVYHVVNDKLSTLGMIDFPTRLELVKWMTDHRDRWYCNALLITLRRPLTLEPDL